MSAGVSYFGNRILRHVAADMEDLARRGFTGVLHTFTENDLAYYRKTMEQIVEASHAAGLEVQIAPWGVCQMFGGEAESRFTARRPELGQVLDTGRATPSGCPNQADVRSFVRKWADAAVETGADRIFWDEPHWVHPEHFGLPAEHWGCRCEACRAQFREQAGSEMPTELTNEVLAFRESSMLEFLAELVGHVRGLGARTTVCLLPLTGGVHGISDWSRVAALPGLDSLATDPYWKVFGEPVEPFVGQYAGRLRELGDRHGVGAQLWIQGFRLEPGDEDDVVTAVRVARQHGIDDLWTWGYEACGHMSSLAGSDPPLVWEILGRELAGAAAPPRPRETQTHDPGLLDLDLRSALDVVQALNATNQDVLAAVGDAEPELARIVDAVAERIGEEGRVVYAGAGSAGLVAALDASEWSPTFGWPQERIVALVAGSGLPDGPERDRAEDDADAGAADLAHLALGPLDTVIGVSASGETPYVLGAVRAARSAGALTVALVCRSDTTLGSEAEHVLEALVGAEVLTGSTRLKAGTAQKLLLNAFSTALMVKLGRTYGNLMTGMRVGNDKLRARAERLGELVTGRPRADVADALDASGNDVRVAILMLAGELDERAARERLVEAGGVLRTAIEGMR
jgi:N-acetylmuramic acid 6-phosphate etherase